MECYTVLSIGLLVMLTALAVAEDDGINSCDQCHLPECYCKYKVNPGARISGQKPQLITLSYTGKVTEDVVEILTRVFYSTKFRNPNDCGIGVTIFVHGVDTDYCSVHKLYSLGWEIATSGNTTASTAKWKAVENGKNDFEDNTETHRQKMIELAKMNVDDVIGMRTLDHRTSSDSKLFDTLWNNGFTYDSTLIVEPQVSDNEKIQPWPFTLDLTMNTIGLHGVKGDPQKRLPGLWEVPLTRLLQNNSASRTCDYLHTCLGGLSKSSQLTELLKYNLHHNEATNGAPLQINLREKDLGNKRIMDGLNAFLEWALRGEETHYWVMTVEQVLRWIQTPSTNRDMIRGVGATELCVKRRTYHRCGKAKERRMRIANPFREIMDVESLWIYQSVLLLVSYVLIRRYDKMQVTKKYL